MSLSSANRREGSDTRNDRQDVYRAIKGFLFERDYTTFDEIYSAVEDHGSLKEVRKTLSDNSDFSAAMFRHEDTEEIDLAYRLEE